MAAPSEQRKGYESEMARGEFTSLESSIRGYHDAFRYNSRSHVHSRLASSPFGEKMDGSVREDILVVRVRPVTL